jgi:hypothetical protein
VGGDSMEEEYVDFVSETEMNYILGCLQQDIYGYPDENTYYDYMMYGTSRTDIEMYERKDWQHPWVLVSRRTLIILGEVNLCELYSQYYL